MQSTHSLTAFAALLAIASPLAAQRVQVYEMPRSRATASAPTTMTVTASRRGLIGVTIDMRPGANDSIGATLSGVTPGGPAARAGLLAGDIVTKFNGTALADRRRRNADTDEAEERSGPGLRMLELAAQMTPGDTVTVEWKRDRERNRRTARLVAEAGAGMVFGAGPEFRVYTGEGPGRFKFNFDEGPARMTELEGRLEALRGSAATVPGMSGERFFLRVGGPFGGIQFAPLNADLGRYFGTAEGVLILETPDSSAHVDLKGGDVILAVGDRKPTSVEHLFRILGSYEDEETVRFDVMRDKRRITVEARAREIRGTQRVRIYEGRSSGPARVQGHPTEELPGDRPAPRQATPRSGT